MLNGDCFQQFEEFTINFFNIYWMTFSDFTSSSKVFESQFTLFKCQYKYIKSNKTV